MYDVNILDQSENGPFPALVSGEIHLWTLSLDASEEQIERLHSVLSSAEKEQSAYFKFEPLQHNYIISRAALRMLLSVYTGTAPEEINLRIHRKGKPYLLNDTSLFFNMADSQGLCVYSFSCDAEVGIDIEKIRDLPDIDQLIEKNLTTREKKYFRKDPKQKLYRFFQFWTFKESYLKAIGEGMRLTPENLEFSLEDGTIRLQSAIGGDESDWQFKDFSRQDSYTGTLAYKGRNTVIREMNLTLPS